MSSTDLVQGIPGACQCSQKQTGGQAAAPAGADQGSEVVPAPASETTDGAVLSIDVSHLPPPLPMVRILETLRDLGPGETLLVHHTRRPIHLYPKLEGLGCTHETTELPGGKIQVRITNPPSEPS